jgi:signal transduction histidine kinase
VASWPAGALDELLTLQRAIVAQDATLEDVMRTICERATSLTGADGATIEMEDGDTLVYRAATGALAPFLGFRVAREGSLSGLAVRSGDVLLCEDSEEDPRVDREACRRVGARSMLIAPLVHEGRIQGVLKVSSQRPRTFTKQTSDLLRLAGGFLGAAMMRAAASDARAALARRERERMMELERLREELAALVVHDLRSPLTSIRLNLEFVREHLPGESLEALEAALDAMVATQRLEALVSTLLETAKLEHGRLDVTPKGVAVAEMVEALCSERRHTLRARRVSVVQDVSPGFSLHADAALLRRVIDNIVDNALRHTPPGGSIRFSASDTGAGGVLRIANNGPPIPVEARERVFEKFTQQARGTLATFGLGLYFCRLVAEAHKGRIWIESNDAWPAIFALELPDPRP